MYVWFKQSERFSVLSVASPVLVGLTWSILTPKKYRKAIADWISVGLDLFNRFFCGGLCYNPPVAADTQRVTPTAQLPIAPFKARSGPIVLRHRRVARLFPQLLRHRLRHDAEPCVAPRGSTLNRVLKNTPGSCDEQACWKGDHLGPKETDPILYQDCLACGGFVLRLCWTMLFADKDCKYVWSSSQLHYFPRGPSAGWTTTLCVWVWLDKSTECIIMYVCNVM